ncbi:hypothetical protein [Pseudomonas savastanoi]|uniref:hypothetical protein n=1 Tax=Pseudomonas savastanoi TaxID=29438 RepID=UPI00177F4910|nr:hypothetical protein [Pseudomonas savastanoi]QOI04568.1 hypothetical protein D5S10_12195 [Pseudomonas savastanoi]
MSNETNDVRSPCELLPCPYCGRAARYVAEDYVDNSGEPWPFAECDACNTGAPVEFWNKRAQPAEQQGEPSAWANGERLLLCSRSRLDVGHSNPIYHDLPRNIAGSALKTEYCDTPLYLHTRRATAKVVLPERETLRDVIAAVIGGDAYDCTRVWSAWGVGTMSDDDFVPIVEQEERLYELVDACLDEVAKLNSGQA